MTIVEFSLLMLLGLGNVVLMTLYCQRLEQRHEEEWQHLGGPGFRPHTPSASAQLLKFLWSRPVQEAEDPELGRRGRVWRMYLIVAAVVATPLLVHLVILLATGKT
jgi:hypothetical protein